MVGLHKYKRFRVLALQFGGCRGCAGFFEFTCVKYRKSLYVESFIRQVNFMTPELAKRVFDVFVSLEERRGKALTQAIADVFPDMPEGMRESIGFDVRKFFHSAEGDEPFVLPENMAQIFIAACRRQGIPIDKLSDVVTKNENDGSLTLDLPTIFAASEQFKEGRKPG